MNCNETRNFLDAYIDNELDAANTQGIENHLGTCKACHKLLEIQNELRSIAQSSMPYHPAPAGLNERILSSLPDSGITKKAAGSPDDKRKVRDWKSGWLNKNWATGAAMAFSLVLTVSAVISYQHHQEEEHLMQDVLEGHLRSVSTEHLTDISSSSASVISTWLKSHLDYAPTVPDLTKQGLKLIGARLEYLQKRKVASVIYKKNGSIINLFTWPSPNVADAENEAHTRQGYKLVYWCQDYMNYWVISDLDKKSLSQVANYMQASQGR